MVLCIQQCCITALVTALVVNIVIIMKLTLSAFTSTFVDNVVESNAAVDEQENCKCHPHLHFSSKWLQFVPKKLLLSLDFPLCLTWSPGHYLARLFEVRPHPYQEVTEKHSSDNNNS